MVTLSDVGHARQLCLAVWTRPLGAALHVCPFQLTPCDGRDEVAPSSLHVDYREGTTTHRYESALGNPNSRWLYAVGVPPTLQGKMAFAQFRVLLLHLCGPPGVVQHLLHLVSAPMFLSY